MALKTELAQIKESQQFISTQFEELKTENAKLIKSNKNLEKENQKLRDEVDMLHDAQTDQFKHLDNLEQYGRRENLEFEGILLVQNEDATEIVIKLAEKLNVCALPFDSRLHSGVSQMEPFPSYAGMSGIVQHQYEDGSAAPRNVSGAGRRHGGARGGDRPPNDFLTIFPNRLEPQSFFQGAGG